MLCVAESTPVSFGLLVLAMRNCGDPPGAVLSRDATRTPGDGAPSNRPALDDAHHPDLSEEHGKMLAQFTHASVSGLWRERPESWISGLRARSNALARRILKALVRIGASMLAISIVIFLHVVLTAHLVVHWQETLAHFLPFLDW
jgi:hypothetical protein